LITHDLESVSRRISQHGKPEGKGLPRKWLPQALIFSLHEIVDGEQGLHQSESILT
jgi:hypothetical protein